MTSKLKTLMEKNPPRHPSSSLADLVKDWDDRYIHGPEKHRRDPVVQFCAEAKNLTEAIKRACASRGANGKMFNHQSKVKEMDRQIFASNIIRYQKLLEDQRCNFDELHDILERIAPAGIGPVTIYDVATRIGAFLGREPQSLYLHAGVRIGIEALYGKPIADKRILKQNWPVALRSMPADQVEDFLCCYREFLHPGLLLQELLLVISQSQSF
jgi:hypothetical protein